MVQKLGHEESRSQIPGKFWNVVLRKTGEDQFDRSCEKLNITQNEGGKTHHAYNKTKESYLVCVGTAF
jgi:hypothetical protein